MLVLSLKAQRRTIPLFLPPHQRRSGGYCCAWPGVRSQALHANSWSKLHAERLASGHECIHSTPPSRSPKRHLRLLCAGPAKKPSGRYNDLINTRGRLRSVENDPLFTPRLWTTISIDFNDSTTTLDFERAFAAAKTFLQRSGTLPLHISLIDQYSPPALDSAPLITLIAEHSERWRYIRFDMPQSHHLAHNNQIQNRLPSLEHLGLFTSGDSQAHRYLISSEYQIAPSLTSVHIGTSAFSLNDSVLPWHQLLSFRASFIFGILGPKPLCRPPLWVR
ncbi:hypothetical protein K443DRAFT_684766 [Laccaria amethystina LaAM-08-1]|uniref:Uncharacterized protein n=1 Tax=Laccaria amethystina LaAM-08-1 TaxID=1095629 RepID=A0A0C9XA23_9AGAR|nr:hypothetical protein K443DRAFT_684766 [Laccaria amethystina LaAM-08-1]